MSKANDGGQAFPQNQACMMGMNLRQWYAGMALATLMHTSSRTPSSMTTEEYVQQQADDTADFAFRVADAMIERGAR